jgi:hypothetical protein
MKKRIHKLLFYTLLLSVYGVFFSVESFFNFEGQTNARAIFGQATLLKGAAGSNVVKPSPLNSSSGHNFRLNKRFHKEDISLCPIICIELPGLRIIPLVLCLYRSVPFPSVQLIHYPLRGPPVVA